jgi:hypothetical protein
MLLKQDKKLGISCIVKLLLTKFEEDDQFLKGKYEAYIRGVGIKKGV